MREAVAASVQEALASLDARPGVSETSRVPHPLQLLSAREVAELLALDVDTVYQIPGGELPRVKVGPSRGSTRFLAVNVGRYALGLPPLDHQRLLDRLERSGPKVQPLKPTGSTKPSGGRHRLV